MDRDKALTARYLEEGILALVPVGREGAEATLVYTQMTNYRDSRSLRWVLSRLAAHMGLDAAHVRQYYAQFLERRHHIPFPLSPGLVLLPLRMGEARDVGGGYVNGLQVARVAADGPRRSHIHFKGGLVLPCHTTRATAQERILQGEAVLQEYLRCQGHREAAPQGGGGLKTPETEEIPGSRFFLSSLLQSIFRGQSL